MNDNDNLQITGRWVEQVPVLEIDYTPAQMFQPRIADLLGERLISEYRALKPHQPRACVLHIKATTAGSPLVRAIFELYKVVSSDSGTLYCASYPVNYMESLTSLGLTALPGFKLAATLDEALGLAKTGG